MCVVVVVVVVYIIHYSQLKTTHLNRLEMAAAIKAAIDVYRIDFQLSVIKRLKTKSLCRKPIGGSP